MSTLRETDTRLQTPGLEEYVRQIEAIKGDAGELVEGLSDARFRQRPGTGQWSISECVVHLNMTGGVYLPPIDDAIRAARSQGLFGEGPFRPGLLVRWFVGRYIEPPPRKKFKSPSSLEPPQDEPLAKAMPEFMTLQEQFLERIREASGLNLSRAKVKFSVIPYLKPSLAETLSIVLAHERRHLWQAWRVRRELG